MSTWEGLFLGKKHGLYMGTKVHSVIMYLCGTGVQEN